ncbi:MAG TPA: O-methyltransferase [Verrucomicrobiae bacterium]|nr:O-methyltransferase [Verrucomicrobiae bacterium]
MKSKQSPAYHLRTNKAVERVLFLELLRKLDGNIPVGKCKYVSLGGPYLEDFLMIHGAFGNRDMVSLEIKEHVRSRQRINQPHSQVALTLDSTSNFVEKYQTGRKPLLVWFDYEWPDWKKQIAESCELVQLLPQMSIFKITLSGKTDWLGGEAKDPLPDRAKKVTEMFGDYGNFTAADINEESICDTLYKILRAAIAEAVPDAAAKAVRTLASYQYNDGTPILTVIMVIGPLGEIEKIEAKLRSWPFANLKWSNPQQINIPHLSLRERLLVDRLLPNASAKLLVKKFQLCEKYADSIRLMKNYIQFYGQVPQFLRVSF